MIDPAPLLAKPIVLLDCDGVLCNFIGGMLEVVQAITGRTRTHDEIDQFDFCAALGLTANEASQVKRYVSGADGFCSSLAVYPNAQNGVTALESIAEVHIVTSPWNSCRTWTHERESWLKTYFDIPHSRIHHSSAKHLFRGAMLIDDKASTVSAWRDAWPSGVPVLWSTPHNRKDLWDGPCTNDWGHLIELLEAAR